MFAQSVPALLFEPNTVQSLITCATAANTQHAHPRPTVKNTAPCGKLFSASTLAGLVLFPLAQLCSAQGFAALEPHVNRHLEAVLHTYAKRQDWQVVRTGAQHQWQGLPPPACTSTPSIQAAPAEPLARQRLTLKCPAPRWQASVLSEPALWVKAVYATQSLERGATLTAQHLELRELTITRTTRDFYSALNPVLGLGAKRRIRAGQLLSPSLLAQAKLVSRGEAVKILASQQGITATTNGQALSDGTLGEVIRVRNSTSEKVIEAKVIGKGEVSSLY